YTTPVSVNLTTNTATGINNTFSNIIRFIGTDSSNTANSTISGLGSTSVSALNTGLGASASFVNFGNLIGSGTLDISLINQGSINLADGTSNAITGTLSGYTFFIGSNDGTLSGLGNTTITGNNS